MAEKLTPEQQALLRLASQGEVDTTWGHPDAESLAERGLVTIRRCVPASAFVGGQVVKITPAGRSTLQENPHGE
mgnify:CR=1 FL=1